MKNSPSTKKQAKKKPLFNPLFPDSIDYKKYDFNQLAAAWIEYQQLQEELTFTLPVPVPLQFFTIQEWNKYNKELENYNQEFLSNQQHNEELESEIKKLTRAIHDLIPENNMWFISEDKKYAIAIKYSSFGGGQWDIKVIENPDLNNLQFP